jgi:hypothetical protein
MSKIAIIYAYYEKNIEYRTNLDFFLKKGVYANDEHIDYFIVVNGITTYSFPHYSNVKVCYRENTGFDFAGYNYGINESNKTGKEYEYYIFINSTCRGPFLPEYCNHMKWTEPFIREFYKDSDVKMVGATINLLLNDFKPHVQSYFFALKVDALNYVQQNGLFERIYNKREEVIYNQEIELSLLLLRNGWNITCLVPEYQNINYAQLLYEYKEGTTHQCIIKNNLIFYTNKWYGDIVFPEKLCFGRDIHPYEVIFIKTERGLFVEELHSLTNYYLKK